MPSFSATSNRKLEGINIHLQDLCRRVVTMHHDCTVIYGLRTPEEQKRLFDAGLSKTMNSKHLTGKAVDIAPYPIDWDNTKRFYFFAGIMLATWAEMKEEGHVPSSLGLRWGGDWDMDNDLDDQTFMDLVHFEVVLLEDYI